MIAEGNRPADAFAKRAAGYQTQWIMAVSQFSPEELLPPITLDRIKEQQEKMSPQELTVWKQRSHPAERTVARTRWQVGITPRT